MSWAILLVGWLAWSGIAVFVRGMSRVTRTYGPLDALFGVAEIAFLIWIVVTRL